MAPEPLARRDVEYEPSEADYDSFCATLMETGRGRWFLSEYARRHSNANTATALEALRRIEDTLRSAQPAADIGRLREQLRSLAATVRGAKRDIGWSDSEFSKGAKVMALLDLLEQRIIDMIWSQQPGQSTALAPSASADDKPDTARVQLTVISANASHITARSRIEPPMVELVQESPAAAQQSSAPIVKQETVAAVVAAPVVEIHPDDMFVPFELDEFELPQAEPAVADVAVVIEPPAPAPVAAPVAARPAAKAYDAMTPVMALSEDERMALVS